MTNMAASVRVLRVFYCSSLVIETSNTVFAGCGTDAVLLLVFAILYKRIGTFLIDFGIFSFFCFTIRSPKRSHQKVY